VQSHERCHFTFIWLTQTYEHEKLDCLVNRQKDQQSGEHLTTSLISSSLPSSLLLSISTFFMQMKKARDWEQGHLTTGSAVYLHKESHTALNAGAHKHHEYELCAPGEQEWVCNN